MFIDRGQYKKVKSDTSYIVMVIQVPETEQIEPKSPERKNLFSSMIPKLEAGFRIRKMMGSPKATRIEESHAMERRAVVVDRSFMNDQRADFQNNIWDTMNYKFKMMKPNYFEIKAIPEKSKHHY